LNKADTEEQLTNSKYVSEYPGVVWPQIINTKLSLSGDYFTRFQEMLDKANLPILHITT
jgi:hypothetical protein